MEIHSVKSARRYVCNINMYTIEMRTLHRVRSNLVLGSAKPMELMELVEKRKSIINKNNRNRTVF